jgi:hypothetical protein
VRKIGWSGFKSHLRQLGDANREIGVRIGIVGHPSAAGSVPVALVHPAAVVERAVEICSRRRLQERTPKTSLALADEARQQDHGDQNNRDSMKREG